MRTLKSTSCRIFSQAPMPCFCTASRSACSSVASQYPRKAICGALPPGLGFALDFIAPSAPRAADPARSVGCGPSATPLESERTRPTRSPRRELLPPAARAELSAPRNAVQCEAETTAISSDGSASHENVFGVCLARRPVTDRAPRGRFAILGQFSATEKSEVESSAGAAARTCCSPEKASFSSCETNEHTHIRPRGVRYPRGRTRAAAT